MKWVTAKVEELTAMHQPPAAAPAPAPAATTQLATQNQEKVQDEYPIEIMNKAMDLAREREVSPLPRA